METRVFRLTVRFLLSTVLAPRGVQKPTRSLRSKTLPPLSPFHSPCVMCNGVGCGCLSVQHPPLPRRTSSPSLQARRGRPADVWSDVRLSSAPRHLFTELRTPDREKSKPGSANPLGLAQGCEPPCPLGDSREPCLVRKEHLVTAPDCAA